MAVQLLNTGPLYGGNPEEDEHAIAVTCAYARILGNSDIIIVVAETCRYCGRIC